jgi:hypothetical protein
MSKEDNKGSSEKVADLLGSLPKPSTYVVVGQNKIGTSPSPAKVRSDSPEKR